MTFGALLIALSGPIAKQVLRALGIGIVSFVGLEAGMSALLEEARTSWNSVGGDVAQYLALAGANHGLALIAGAMIGRLSMSALKAFRLL